MKRRLQFTFRFVALTAILLGADSAAIRLRFNPYDAVVQPAARAQTARQRRPNIVLIFPDNLGWGEVGVYGSDASQASAVQASIHVLERIAYTGRLA